MPPRSQPATVGLAVLSLLSGLFALGVFALKGWVKDDIMPYVVAMAISVLGSRFGRAWVAVVLSAAFGFVFIGRAYALARESAQPIEAAITLAYGASCFMTTINIFIETRHGATHTPRQRPSRQAAAQQEDGAGADDVDPASRPWKQVPKRKAARDKAARESE